jgi:hypothetical protein
MPNISELFQRIDGYDFASTLDLRLGFHHALLSEYASNVFTTVLPWGKYSYTRMPLGYTGAPDVFQHRMDQILGDLPFCAFSLMALLFGPRVVSNYIYSNYRQFLEDKLRLMFALTS